MDTSKDYDEDGNNIVACPICLNVYCSSKEGGKCPEEEEFKKSLKIKTMKTSKSKMKKVYSYPEDWEKLKNHAKKSGKSMSQIIREFIRTLKE